MYDECFWHGHEPTTISDYKDCFECGHVWRTPEDFLADVRTLFDDLAKLDGIARTPTLDLPYCPLCSHDF